MCQVCLFSKNFNQIFFLSLFQVGEVVGANEQAIRGEIKKNK